MSAFVVSHTVIDGLISAAIALEVYAALDRRDQGFHNVTAENATDYGRMLLAANWRAVRTRYPDLDKAPAQGEDDPDVMAYQFRPVSPESLVWTPGLTAKRIECLEYQCCEADDWDQSLAHEFLYRLMLRLVRKLPGYDASKWGE